MKKKDVNKFFVIAHSLAWFGKKHSINPYNISHDDKQNYHKKAAFLKSITKKQKKAK